VNQPPDIPINQLLSSEDTITGEGRQLCLSTYLWRDFQPISPPDGKPLIALIHIIPTDTAQLPSTIITDAIWIIYGQQIWKSWFENENPPPDPYHPNSISKIARGGPKWGPGVYVTVVVRIKDRNNNSQLLRASNQMIYRTD